MKQTKIVAVKTAIMVVERPHFENPQGKTEKYQIELKEGETLDQAEKRYQKQNWPLEYKWITKDGLHQRKCVNYYKVPLVVNSYYGPVIEKEIEVEIPDEPEDPQISIWDYLNGRIKL